jgi:hypothetical protein
MASLLAAGPDVLSVPVHSSLANVSGYLATFLAGGGRIAWGVVETDGPMFLSVDRSWKQLSHLWDTLVARGVEAELLRERCLVTPHCGLGMHTPSVAEKVCAITRVIGQRVAAWSPRPLRRGWM